MALERTFIETKATSISFFWGTHVSEIKASELKFLFLFNLTVIFLPVTQNLYFRASNKSDLNLAVPVDSWYYPRDVFCIRSLARMTISFGRFMTCSNCLPHEVMIMKVPVIMHFLDTPSVKQDRTDGAGSKYFMTHGSD